MDLDSLQDQTGENNGRISALQGIDGTHDFHNPPCKHPNTMNEGISTFNIDVFQHEDEVNSKTARANIPEVNQEVPTAQHLLALVNVLPLETRVSLLVL